MNNPTTTGEQLDRQIADIIRREYPEVLVWPHTRVTAVINAAIAAEREARQLAEHNMTNWHQAALRDSAKLAAERERIRELERITSATGREAQLREQLAAAVEALKAIASGAVIPAPHEIADAALAKIGGKP